MEINLSRRFRKLINGIDDFPGELEIRTGKLSLVCIAGTINPDGSKGKIYHEDGIYELAQLSPAENGYCNALVLKEDGKTERVKFTYIESGILVPSDELSFQLPHPGIFRKPHNSVSTKKALEPMTGEAVLVNDNKPPKNNIYSTRIIDFCNGEGYNAQIKNPQGEIETVKFGYDSVAGVLVPEKKFPSYLRALRID